ncbi:MAG: amidase, partial [Gammaproteobacteria bacterium]|nr:amidase [Gammaproteobacteria bacterium]
MTIPHWQLNARTLARGIREGEFTAEAAVTSVLERIDTRNPAINAIVARCDDEALAAARKADDMVRRG